MVTLALPTSRGRSREDELQAFAEELQRIQSTIDFKVSAIGRDPGPSTEETVRLQHDGRASRMKRRKGHSRSELLDRANRKKGWRER